MLTNLIIIPLVGILMPFILILVLKIWQKHQIEKSKAPFTDNFLRSPGESLFNQIQDLSERITTASFEFIFIPVFIAVIFIPFISTSNIIFFVIGTVTYLFFGIYYTHKILKLIGQRRLLRLGYDGEVAAGQELNQLMLDGFNVYHDFPADKFNIDHILVGPDAVYAVETKARSKLKKKDRENHKVISDGKTIQFSGYSSSEFIDQADRQAKWLQTWLNKAVGNNIAVKPVVLLPGWFVERKAPDGVPVLNPKMVRQFFSSKEKTISQSLRTRINHQLEQKCRDIEPETVQIERQ
jgi:hypothetical protein